jgi:hypothetical protein
VLPKRDPIRQGLCYTYFFRSPHSFTRVESTLLILRISPSLHLFLVSAARSTLCSITQAHLQPYLSYRTCSGSIHLTSNLVVAFLRPVDLVSVAVRHRPNRGRTVIEKKENMTDDPVNAHIPTINKLATLRGVTLTFLVGFHFHALLLD